MKNRLTWHQSGPLPFESSWSIIAKVLALNHISFIELVRLIQKSDGRVEHVHPRLFLKSDWVDFSKFSELLGVEVTQLQTGFLDRLGFQIHTKTRKPHYAVRHCPACLSLGYHCSLFDLAIIQVCPWHNVSLSRGCRLCASPYLMQRGTMCSRCGFKPPIHTLPHAHAWFTATKCAAVDTSCNAFLSWWKIVSESRNPFADVIERICEPRSGGTLERRQREQNLAYARALWPVISQWTRGRSNKTYKVAVWKAELAPYPGIAQPVLMASDLGRSYRSIRRQILKRYLKGHERCLTALQQLTANERLSLNADAVCPVALTYLSWKTSIEGPRRCVGTRATLSSTNLAFASAPGTNMKNSSRIRISYLNFFGILDQLYTALRKCTIIISFTDQSKIYLQTRIKFAQGDVERNFSEPVIADVIAMVPMTAPSERENLCSKTRLRQVLVSGDQPYRPADAFDDTTYQWRQYYAFLRRTEAGNLTGRTCIEI